MLTVSSFFRLSLPHDNNGKISPCTCIGLLFLLLIDLVNRPSLSHGNSPVSIKLSLASVEHHSSQSVDFHRRSILPCSILFLLLWQVLLSLSPSRHCYFSLYILCINTYTYVITNRNLSEIMKTSKWILYLTPAIKITPIRPQPKGTFICSLDGASIQTKTDDLVFPFSSRTMTGLFLVLIVYQRILFMLDCDWQRFFEGWSSIVAAWIDSLHALLDEVCFLQFISFFNSVFQSKHVVDTSNDH